MNCHLCGQPKSCPETVFCATCARKLISGFHPVVCAGCRKHFGQAFGVVWIARNVMDERLVTAINDMQRKTKGVATFVRRDCETCRALYPAQDVRLIASKTRGMN